MLPGGTPTAAFESDTRYTIHLGGGIMNTDDDHGDHLGRAWGGSAHG